MASVALAALVGASGAAGLGVPTMRTPGEAGVVARVHDGDTLSLTDGRKVRLVQIDTPELRTGECYSRKARSALVALAPTGSRITLERDPRLDGTDRYGRVLRYVRRGGVNVNLELVRRGAAAVWFFEGARGVYADAFLAAMRDAKAAKVGLWGACPGTEFNPFRGVETGISGPRSKKGPSGGTCDPSYIGVCIPPPPPDLDCGDLGALDVARPVRVVGRDPHGLDGDRDGVGC